MSILNGQKYIHLMDGHELKKLSLIDNLYSTFRDIWLNTPDLHFAMRVNDINFRITGEVFYKDRTPNFKYHDVMTDSKLKMDILNLFRLNNLIGFDFEWEIEPDDNIADYQLYSEWQVNYNQLYIDILAAFG